ncbi:hypothetical protein [Massilia sp. PWRC2]|uniref:hypothetical protein n=1 Tax=Massilia sp. PWRC2 TaxID=2804626 RepID=UPI003CE7666C
MTNPLHVLETMADAGMQPVRREVWLGLGFRPPKRNAIEIDPARLPSFTECWPVVGLDIILVYHGNATRYGTLRDLSHRLYGASPRRLQLIDLDAGRIAFLKLMGVS